MFAMLNKEIQVEVDVLHRQGKGIRAIEREMGLARNTIRAILRGQHDGRYGPRTPRPTKVGPFKSYLQERLDAAGKVQLPATVLLREIRAQGYEGGITQLKEYLREVRPARPPEPIVRFETKPGSQLQIDFVVLRRGALPLRAFTAELGYSRYAYVEFTDNERSSTRAQEGGNQTSRRKNCTQGGSTLNRRLGPKAGQVSADVNNVDELTKLFEVTYPGYACGFDRSQLYGNLDRPLRTFLAKAVSAITILNNSTRYHGFFSRKRRIVSSNASK